MDRKRQEICLSFDESGVCGDYWLFYGDDKPHQDIKATMPTIPTVGRKEVCAKLAFLIKSNTVQNGILTLALQTVCSSAGAETVNLQDKRKHVSQLSSSSSEWRLQWALLKQW